MVADKLIEIAKSEIGYLEKSKEAVEADPDVLYDFTKGAGSDNYTKYAVEQWQERYFNGKRLPFPSPSPGVCSDSCPLTR